MVAKRNIFYLSFVGSEKTPPSSAGH